MADLAPIKYYEVSMVFPEQCYFGFEFATNADDALAEFKRKLKDARGNLEGCSYGKARWIKDAATSPQAKQEQA